MLSLSAFVPCRRSYLVSPTPALPHAVAVSESQSLYKVVYRIVNLNELLARNREQLCRLE